MKLRFRGILIFLCLILICSASVSRAQFRNYSIKGGIQYSQLFPNTEFYDNKDYKSSYLLRGFFRFEMTTILDLEVGAGYGSLAGLSVDKSPYRTDIIPINTSLILNPFHLSSINPYLSVGFGMMRYWMRTYHQSESPINLREKKWTGYIPAFIGTEIRIAPTMVMDISGGYTYTFTDELNYYIDTDKSPKDGYWSISIGFSFFDNSGEIDSDGDGLTDIYEQSIGLNYLSEDTDRDKLDDFTEVKIHYTNPFTHDTDKDELSDFEEIMTYQTYPTNADSDNDELLDGFEVFTYKTDPLNPDTDADKLTDYEEVIIYFSDPLKTDTDGEKLNDYDEVKVHKTDPNNIDTDGGKADDFVEIENGTDPNDPSDDMTIIGTPFIIQGVSFNSEGELEDNSTYALLEILEIINANPDFEFEIRAYTDNIGNSAYNTRLTQKQANNVVEWLVERGAASYKISGVGYGSDNPIASNDTQEGRMQNRRIELVRSK